MTGRIALATAAEFPDLDEDGPALIGALAARGLTAEPAVWTDESLDWASYDAVVVRCTWDYASRRDAFLAWARRVSGVTPLANSVDVLTWNTDKSYLRELTEAGLPVIATTWLEPGDAVRLPEQGEYVVKPAVSVGSKDTNRYLAGDHDELARRHARALLDAGRTVMVQPYLHEVDHYGETALFYFEGVLSHAVRKGPLLQPAMEFVAGAYKQEEIEARIPSEAELAAGDRVLDSLRWPRAQLTYARVDLVPGEGSTPTVLELELTEPSMFLGYHAEAADRFASAIERLSAR